MLIYSGLTCVEGGADGIDLPNRRSDPFLHWLPCKSCKTRLLTQPDVLFSFTLMKTGFQRFRKIKNPMISHRVLQSLAVRTGLEPATHGVTGRYSNQLNYRTKFCRDAKVSDFLIIQNKLLIKLLSPND